MRRARVLHGVAVTLLLGSPCAATASALGADLADDVGALPVHGGVAAEPNRGDYLVDEFERTAEVRRSADAREVVLDNGLVRRVWRVAPNGACVAIDDLMSGRSLLRSVRPEARVTIDGVAHDVGGLVGQPNHAYLDPAWLDAMEAAPAAFALVGLEVGEPEARLGWNRRRHAAPDAAWPPPGAYLRMDYAPPPEAGAPDVVVRVHHELYDGVPVMSKWVTVENRGEAEVTLDRFTGEELAVVEHSSWVETRAGVPLPAPDSIEVVTDFAFGGFGSANANRHVVHWRTDPLFTTQVNYARQTPCLLVCEPTHGPAQRIAPGATFEGFRAFELVHGPGDRERRGLAFRRMMRTIAPWVTENPLTHHLLSHDPERVRQAIDEAAEVGFEAVILSFGSGFDMENRDPEFLERWRAVADHARERGVELGCYSLFSSRFVGEEHMIVPPDGEPLTHGRCPAATSEWGLRWLDTIRAFFAETGFDQFENDGPYPGDVDTTPRPPHQSGAEDSRWAQWRLVSGLYRDLRAEGVYTNAPDFYYLSGSNKCGMGYREVNWSLPRAQQVIHTRQNIFDGTWRRTPSMGWMHVPLAEYHGGGAAATIEPLREHLDHYRLMLRSNLAFGVQAHYRGPRLFDAPETRDVVRAEVEWFMRHRDILESDLIHGRRADGRDVDWMLHVNPRLETCGMLCVFNPLPEQVTRTLRVDLYYTGLEDVAAIAVGGGKALTREVPRDHVVDVTLTIPAGGMVWATITGR